MTLGLAHTTPATRHPETLRSQELLGTKYWLLSMQSDIRKYISLWPSFTQAKALRHSLSGSSCPHHKGFGLTKHWILLLTSRNTLATLILVIVDQFSCSLLLIPLVALPSASESVELMSNHVFRYYGILEDIVKRGCDKGVQFTS